MGDEHGGLEAGGVAERVLILPLAFGFPDGTAVAEFPVVAAVGGAPHGLVVGESGVGEEAFVTSGVALHPVGEIAAVAGAAGSLAGGVDEGEQADGFVGGVVDFGGWSAEDIVVDGGGEAFAVAGRAGVVGHEDDVAGGGEEVIVPAEEPLVFPSLVRTAVHEDEEGVFA